MARKQTLEEKAASQARFFAHIMKTYGLSEDEYRALYRAQGGRCYVCRKASGRNRRLAVDHNHLTGEVRGLVCSGSLDAKTCNRMIAIHDRDAFLRAAAMLSDPPPARIVLQTMREDTTGDPLIPDLVGDNDFRLSAMKR